MPAPTYAQFDCPTCHGPLTRVRRLAHEKSGQDLSDPRRYRCIADGCAWEGLLPRRVRPPPRLTFRRALYRVQRVLLPASALAGLGVTVAAVAWQAGLFAGPPKRGYAPGEHHDGEKLPQAHALTRHHARLERVVLKPSGAPSPASAAEGAASQSSAGVAAPADRTLQLRYGCVWGKPGRNPYRGGVEQALRSAALPEEVVKSIAAQVRAGEPVDRLVIGNDGVRAQGSGRVFDAQNIALTYGHTLCLGSRVNFKVGHTEPAALYEAATVDGRVVAVMVPEVCGNVSVLGQTDESVRNMRLAAGKNTGDDATAARWMPAVLDGTRGAAVAGAASSEIPEPSTLACVLAALGAWAATAVWRQRRR